MGGKTRVQRNFVKDMRPFNVVRGKAIPMSWEPWEQDHMRMMLVPMFEHRVAKLVQTAVSCMWNVYASGGAFSCSKAQSDDFRLLVISTPTRQIHYQVRRKWMKRSSLEITRPMREFRQGHSNGELVRDIQFLLCGKDYSNGSEWVPQLRDAFVDAVRRPLRTILLSDLIDVVLEYLSPPPGPLW